MLPVGVLPVRGSGFGFGVRVWGLEFKSVSRYPWLTMKSLGKTKVSDAKPMKNLGEAKVPET